MLTRFLYLRWQDWLDIFIMAFITYRTMLMIKGTRAIQMLFGLGAVVGLYILSQKSELIMTQWALNNIMNSFILVIVVLFQADIRRALTSVGKTSLFSDRDRERGMEVYALEEVTKACLILSEKKVGALIVIERETGLKDYIEGGIGIDARVTKELIMSIFLPTAPIHDGAVIMRGNRIVAAGCFLPISMNSNLSASLGTRHRAALEISQETDAIVLVVSEETGKISLMAAGRITKNLDNNALWELLKKYFVTGKKEKKW